MARLPRLDLPHVPQHVIQRGNNRLPCFLADEDYARYKSDLFDAATLCGCAIHAYVLMTNHVHMLVTGATHGAVSRMMQRLGRRYVACVNASYHRTGTLRTPLLAACASQAARECSHPRQASITVFGTAFAPLE